MLNPTPPDRLVDQKGRPYFLWDDDLTLEAFRERLADPDPTLRGYFVGKLLRQAKPDDALSFVTLREIDELWPHIEPYLGRRREFWSWLREWWLVADPVPLAEPPVAVSTGDATIQVDTPHQILVNKLCALLSRSELRDLWDVQVLVDAGGDLERALADAPKQDAGFSPLTISWSLQQLPLRRLSAALAWPEELIARLERFREEVVARILAAAVPE